MKNPAKKSLNIDLPADLYDEFSKICIDAQITRTKALIKYIYYLRSLHKKKRKLLDERFTSSTFDPLE